MNPVKLILRASNSRWRTNPANASLVSFSMESCRTSTKLPILGQPDRSSPSIGIGIKLSVGSSRDLPRYRSTRSALKWLTLPHARPSIVHLDDDDTHASTTKMSVWRDERPLCSHQVRNSTDAGGGPDLATQPAASFRRPREHFGILVVGLDSWPTVRAVCRPGRRQQVCGHARSFHEYRWLRPHSPPRGYSNSGEDEHIADGVVEFEPLSEQHNCQHRSKHRNKMDERRSAVCAEQLDAAVEKEITEQ